jgi:hypothetical protein
LESNTYVQIDSHVFGPPRRLPMRITNVRFLDTVNDDTADTVVVDSDDDDDSCCSCNLSVVSILLFSCLE